MKEKSSTVIYAMLVAFGASWTFSDTLHSPQKNILISRDGKAIVCGFDPSEFSNVRWSV